jgi:hypothetical protein
VVKPTEGRGSIALYLALAFGILFAAVGGWELSVSRISLLFPTGLVVLGLTGLAIILHRRHISRIEPADADSP